jgi:hypothetical protein
MPDKLYKPPYAFSVTIGEYRARQFRAFHDLAEKLKMPVEDLMRQCNGHVPPSKTLVNGVAKELGIDEAVGGPYACRVCCQVVRTPR